MRYREFETVLHIQSISIAIFLISSTSFLYATAQDITDDGCHRIWYNSMLLNARPYARNSLVDVDQCKAACFKSSESTPIAGVRQKDFKCKSFVYDVQYRVCDLFGHTAGEPPAKLQRMVGRNYFEPSGGGVCKETYSQHAAIQNVRTYQKPASITEVPIKSRKRTQPEQRNSLREIPKQTAIPGASCGDGEVPKFVQIERFALASNDDFTVHNVKRDQCLRMCANNQVPQSITRPGKSVPCRSVDYDSVTSECRLSREVMIPDGNGQLQASHSSSYYQKHCLENRIAKLCPGAVYLRDPQKILVGFAETVIYAKDFTHCLSACIDSQIRFGFSCISGMYYLKNLNNQNCILNHESRHTQAKLYGDERVEQVDYFELPCTRQNTPRRLLGPRDNKVFQNLVFDAQPKTDPRSQTTRSQQKSQISEWSQRGSNSGPKQRPTASYGEWTSWGPCDRAENGRRVRYLACGRLDIRECPMQSDRCNGRTDGAIGQDNISVAAEPDTFSDFTADFLALIDPVCRDVFGVCCSYDSSYTVGVVQLADGRFKWCNLDPPRT